jgi:hypothetical protein
MSDTSKEYEGEDYGVAWHPIFKEVEVNSGNPTTRNRCCTPRCSGLTDTLADGGVRP